MKLHFYFAGVGCHTVAPRTGAWIETVTAIGGILTRTVAPRTGAWIET